MLYPTELQARAGIIASYATRGNFGVGGCARDCAREPSGHVLKVGGTRDVIAVEHAARAVSRDLHGDPRSARHRCRPLFRASSSMEHDPTGGRPVKDLQSRGGSGLNFRKMGRPSLLGIVLLQGRLCQRWQPER
jgi:hypothetical protein